MSEYEFEKEKILKRIETNKKLASIHSIVRKKRGRKKKKSSLIKKKKKRDGRGMFAKDLETNNGRPTPKGKGRNEVNFSVRKRNLEDANLY